MLALKIIGIIVAVIAAIMLIPVGADIAYEGGSFSLSAKVCGVLLQLFPRPPEDESKPKKGKKPKKEKPKKEAPPRQKAKLTLQIVCTILKGAGKLTRAIIGSLRFTRIDVVLGVRGDDPAEAARSYGRLNAWLYPTLGFLDRFLYLDFEQLRLLPDFGNVEPTVKDHVSFRVTARAYAIVFTLLRVLYAFWREKVLDVFI